MILGGMGRYEYIVTGDLIKFMGEAESKATAGQVCAHHSSYRWVSPKLNGQLMQQSSAAKNVQEGAVSKGANVVQGVYLVTGHLSTTDEEKAHAGGNVSTISTAPDSDEGKPPSVRFLLGKLHLKEDKNVRDVLYYISHWDRQRQPDANEEHCSHTSKRLLLAAELRKFIHVSAISAIESRTSVLMSEMRYVATVFVQFEGADLLSDLNEGRSTRAQRVLVTVLNTVDMFGGSLRQFVVDDKGCVAILCFGLMGLASKKSSSSNNCVRAVLCSIHLQKLLAINEEVPCFLGIAYGKVYCGTVGAEHRYVISVCKCCQSLEITNLALWRAFIFHVVISDANLQSWEDR
jgi:hypothetical protein